MTAPPAPETFLSGSRGDVVGPRARARAWAGDLLLDARLVLSGAGRRLDALAERGPVHDVLVLSIYRPDRERLTRALPRLEGSGHRVRLAFGSTGARRHSLRDHTVATDLGGGKFENLNAVLNAAGGPRADWTLVVDDDVELPRRFLGRFLAACDALELGLAQPAQTLGSHAAWEVTRRRGGAVARRTRFVEIGPVTAFRDDVAAELMPFPALRFGWGLDLHWSALAGERGWRLGIVDAVPVRHGHSPVASTYSSEEAIDEARRFLHDRPYVRRAEALETLAVHRSLP